MKCSMLLVLVCAMAETARGDGPDYFYSYYEVAIPLELDLTEIMVLRADDRDDDELARDLAAFGIDPGAIGSGPHGLWFAAIPSPDEQTPTNVTVLIRQLPTTESIDFVSPVFKNAEGQPVVVTRDLLVGFSADVRAGNAEAILRGADAGKILDRDYARMKGVYRLRTSFTNGLDVLEAANSLAARPEVRFAEPDLMLTGEFATTPPDDEQFFRSWGLHSTGQNPFDGMPEAWCQEVWGVDCADAPAALPDWDMDLPEAWKTTTGDETIIVVVFECGVELNHPDLVHPDIPSYGHDTTVADAGGYPTLECASHGTWVAGTMCGRINNTIGIVGAAPNCTLASLRFCTPTEACGGFTYNPSDHIDGLTWAEDIGARVINHSYSLSSPSAAMTEKFNQTREAGLIHFSSAGNEGAPPIGYPSSLPSVNAVSNLAYLAPRLNTGSSYGFDDPDPGDAMAFCAPGTLIRTTDRTGDAGGEGESGDPAFDDYTFATGTSFASPYVAGVAALLLSVDPTLSPTDVERVMAAGAVDLGHPGFDERYGAGFVNAANALALLECLSDLPPGPITDCNGNGVDDGCEIDLGLAHDANGDLTLDECQSLTLEDLPVGSIPDCDLPAGAWGWPSNYVYLYCEDDPAYCTIVAADSFKPGTPGNSLALDIPAVDHPIHLPFFPGGAAEEAKTPRVVAAIDVWVPEDDVRGGSIYVGGDHGGGGWGGDDRGPQLDWKNDGRLTAAGAGTILDPFPVGVWQRVRMEIDLATDTYDLWWAEGDAPHVQLLDDHTFLQGNLLDHVDRLTAAYFVNSGVTGPVQAFLDNAVITTCLSDTDLDGTVDVVDLVAIVLAWGSNDPAADTNDDGIVAVEDLVSVILEWGPCN